MLDNEPMGGDTSGADAASAARDTRGAVDRRVGKGGDLRPGIYNLKRDMSYGAAIDALSQAVARRQRTPLGSGNPLECTRDDLVNVFEREFVEGQSGHRYVVHDRDTIFSTKH